MKPALLILAALGACGDPAPAAADEAAGGLKLELAGTEQAYFTRHGKPLLSFGGLSDFIFYATSRDAYDHELWADWAAEHGINHVRAYPPLSWKHMEKFYKENGGDLTKLIFPYEETKPGSRQFDLTRFNDAYWRHFRQQLKYLQSKGIIVHLLMWNGWQLRAAGEAADYDWGGHFFNPGVNVNAFTDHLGGDVANRFGLYHSVAAGKTDLIKAQEAWFEKLVEMTADLDNVYYDLVHELAENHSDWPKVQAWIDAMAAAVLARSKQLRPEKQVIFGMDTGGLKPEQREWIFARPYFDLLIFGKSHTVEQARQWRIRYKKPYVPQESWDDNGQKWGYREPDLRVHTRKYMWKFMLAKCQQMDLYVKPRGRDGADGFPHNYDPRGRNKFEEDARLLRAFWESLTDYPNLWFDGRVERGPGDHRYVLSSAKEAIVYLSSATGKQGVRFERQSLAVRGLALSDGPATVELIKPAEGVIATWTVEVGKGEFILELPEFTDDLAVHLRTSDAREGKAKDKP